MAGEDILSLTKLISNITEGRIPGTEARFFVDAILVSTEVRGDKGVAVIEGYRMGRIQPVLVFELVLDQAEYKFERFPNKSHFIYDGKVILILKRSDKDFPVEVSRAIEKEDCLREIPKRKKKYAQQLEEKEKKSWRNFLPWR